MPSSYVTVRPQSPEPRGRSLEIIPKPFHIIVTGMTLILYFKTASIGGGLNAITSLVYSHSKGNSNVLFLMQQTPVTTQPPHFLHHLQSKMTVDGAAKRKHPGKF